jgi:hypothetical protein
VYRDGSGDRTRADAVSAGDQQGYVLYLTVNKVPRDEYHQLLLAVMDIQKVETETGFCPVVPQHIWWWWRRTVECNGLFAMAARSKHCSVRCCLLKVIALGSRWGIASRWRVGKLRRMSGCLGCDGIRLMVRIMHAASKQAHRMRWMDGMGWESVCRVGDFSLVDLPEKS